MARVTEYNCVGCDTCVGSCAYYNNETYEYYACDGCGESDTTLYHDGKKHYCSRCLAGAHKEDFIKVLWEEILDYFADDYAEGYDVVDQEE